jgi:hypothetical protein
MCRGIDQVSELPSLTGAKSVGDEVDAVLERELDMLLAKAGASVPADRKAGIVAGYRDIKRLAALLRQPRSAVAEPSNIFSLVPLARRTSTHR